MSRLYTIDRWTPIFYYCKRSIERRFALVMLGLSRQGCSGVRVCVLNVLYQCYHCHQFLYTQHVRILCIRGTHTHTQINDIFMEAAKLNQTKPNHPTTLFFIAMLFIVWDKVSFVKCSQFSSSIVAIVVTRKRWDNWGVMCTVLVPILMVQPWTLTVVFRLAFSRYKTKKYTVPILNTIESIS